jgi:hypothetical protein
MSQLDFAQGSPLLAPRESAIVSMLFIFGIMQILLPATGSSVWECFHALFHFRLWT